MELKNPRVRFAPAPTGMMHLGNIRTALMNFLIARQKDGAFILRIEDTDPARNFDPGAIKIREDLAWLGIDYDEGPDKGEKVIKERRFGVDGGGRAREIVGAAGRPP